MQLMTLLRRTCSLGNEALDKLRPQLISLAEEPNPMITRGRFFAIMEVMFAGMGVKGNDVDTMERMSRVFNVRNQPAKSRLVCQRFSDNWCAGESRGRPDVPRDAGRVGHPAGRRGNPEVRALLPHVPPRTIYDTPSESPHRLKSFSEKQSVQAKQMVVGRWTRGVSARVRLWTG